MLKFGIVGVGQAGGNIADYAITKGFSAIALNTAMIDLNMLKYIPDENKLYLKGFNGAGRDRDIGKAAVVSHVEEIFQLIKSKLGECDIVFVAGSGSGGTGSGALPVIADILLELFPLVNIICVFPDDLESPASKMNAYDCFAELTDNPQIGSVFILDNDKGREILKKPKYVIHQVLNENVIDFIYSVNQLTDKASYTNNFDERDLFDILSTRGCTVITNAKIKSSDINDSDISSAIRESWKKTYCPDYNQENVLKAAILGNLPRSMANKFNLSQVFNDNIPYDIRDSLYDLDKNNQQIEFYGIYSGLQFPQVRLDKMKTDIEKVQDEIAKKMEITQNQKIDNVSWKINNPRYDRQINNDNQMSLSERLKKFK